MLANAGLAAAIHTLARRSGSDVSVQQPIENRFPPDIETAMYYCCLEAIQNVTKHAGAHAHTSVQLYIEAQKLHLDVRDDGLGFDTTRGQDGVGLQNMRDRLGAVGGQLEILSAPGRGTLVAAAAPVSRTGSGAIRN